MSAGRRTLTAEEVDALDPAFIDSVAGDRLIATVRSVRDQLAFMHRRYENYVHLKVAMQLAEMQGELAEAAEWAIADVWEWLSVEDIASDPWAFDWRLFWASRDSITGEKADPCGICGAPSTIWTGKGPTRVAACGDRHWLALRGQLPDEQCRLCSKVVVCAHQLGVSPVCADCWPGERLRSEKRVALAKQLGVEPVAPPEPP